MRTFLADGFFADGDARAIDQRLQAAEFLQRGGYGRLAVVFAGHVALDITRLLAKLGGQCLALRLVDVCDDGVAARGDHHFDGGCTESGTAAGDDECAVLDFHVFMRSVL